MFTFNNYQKLLFMKINILFVVIITLFVTFTSCKKAIWSCDKGDTGAQGTVIRGSPVRKNPGHKGPLVLMALPVQQVLKA